MTDRGQVGWGIIGLGNIAHRMAAAVSAVERAALIHVCSRDRTRAEKFAAEHGASASSDSFDALLKDDHVEAVYVATPNALHAEQTIKALEAGKHVLVEKPMALSVTQAEAMVAAARAAGRQLGVGFHLRYHPVHGELRRRVRAGEVGEIVYVMAQWGSAPAIPPDLWHINPRLAGFGSLGGLGVHLLDLVPWLVGDTVSEVVAFDDSTTHGPVEYLTVATLRLAGGAYAHVVSSRRLPFSTHSVTVYGSEQRLEGSGTLTVEPSGELLVTSANGPEVVRPAIPDLYVLEARAFTEALRGGEAFEPCGEDGVRSMAIMEAIREAAGARGVPVRAAAGV